MPGDRRERLPLAHRHREPEREEGGDAANRPRESGPVAGGPGEHKQERRQQEHGRQAGEAGEGDREGVAAVGVEHPPPGGRDLARRPVVAGRAQVGAPQQPHRPALGGKEARKIEVLPDRTGDGAMPARCQVVVPAGGHERPVGEGEQPQRPDRQLEQREGRHQRTLGGGRHLVPGQK